MPNRYPCVGARHKCNYGCIEARIWSRVGSTRGWGKAEGAVELGVNRTQDGFGAGIEGGKSGSGARLSTVPDSGRLSRVPQDEFIGFIIKRGSQYPPRFIIYLLVSSNVKTRVFTPALFAPLFIFVEF